MDSPDETPSIAEALQRITDLAELARREESARRVDILEAQGAIEALEVELLALRPKAQRAAQAEEALQALVLLGWPRETGLDPLEWAKGAVSTEGWFSFQNQIFAFERKLGALQEENTRLKADVHIGYIDQIRSLLKAAGGESIVARVKSVMGDNARLVTALDDAQQQLSETQARLIAPGLEEAHRLNLAELRGLIPGHETADSAQVLRGAIDVITDLRQKTAGRETSVKLADMRMALDGLHDQLVAMGRKEMEHWAAREREIAVFGEETARLPWAGWSPPSIYPIEVYRAVVDKVIALQAAHDKVLEDDSRVVADAAAGIEKMQERVRVAEDKVIAADSRALGAHQNMKRAEAQVARQQEHIFKAAELVDRLIVWAGADERYLLGKMVLDLPAQAWANCGAAIIAAVQRGRDVSKEEIVAARAEADAIRRALLAAHRFDNSTRSSVLLLESIVTARDQAQAQGRQLQSDLEATRTRSNSRADALRALGWDGEQDPIAWAREQTKVNSMAHSWVGKVGNERCWRCHILRDSVAGTVDCPAMNKPEAPPVSG